VEFGLLLRADIKWREDDNKVLGGNEALRTQPRGSGHHIFLVTAHNTQNLEYEQAARGI